MNRNDHFYSGKRHVGQIKFDLYGFEVAIKSTSVMIIRCFTFEIICLSLCFTTLPKSNDFFSLRIWLHRCYWRMFETKCVGDNFEMLLTVSVVSVQKHPKIITNIKSPTFTSWRRFMLETTLRYSWSIRYIDKVIHIMTVTNIFKLSPL